MTEERAYGDTPLLVCELNLRLLRFARNDGKKRANGDSPHKNFGFVLILWAIRELPLQ
jgi:hypothetical protein